MIEQADAVFALYPFLQKIASQHHAAYSHNASGNIVKHEFWFVHVYHTRYNRSKGADDGEELGQENSALRIMIIKILGTHQVFTAEEPAFFSFKEQRTRFFSKPVSYHVSQNGSKHDQY